MIDLHLPGLIVVLGLISEECKTIFLSILVVQTDEQRNEMLLSGGIPMGIGKNSIVRRAIVDKNARIGENVKVSSTKLLSFETQLHPYGLYIVKKVSVGVLRVILPKLSLYLIGCTSWPTPLMFIYRICDDFV